CSSSCYAVLPSFLHDALPIHWASPWSSPRERTVLISARTSHRLLERGSSRLSSAIADRVFGRGGCGRTSFKRPYSLREVRGSTSSLRLERRICAPATKVVQAAAQSSNGAIGAALCRGRPGGSAGASQRLNTSAAGCPLETGIVSD